MTQKFIVTHSKSTEKKVMILIPYLPDVSPYWVCLSLLIIMKLFKYLYQLMVYLQPESFLHLLILHCLQGPGHLSPTL